MDPILPDPTPEALRRALADPGFAPIADGLRRAVAGDRRVDVADAVMSALGADEDAAPLGVDLRSALGGGVDIADLVMDAVAEDDAFAPVAATLRAAVGTDVGSVEVADFVMASIEAAEAASLEAPTTDLHAPDQAEMEISAYFDGEIAAGDRAGVARRLMRDAAARTQVAAYAQLAGELRDAVRSQPDVWADVAHAIGADVEDEAAWSDVAGALRASVTDPAFDVADAVMAGVDAGASRRPLPAPTLPRWASVWAPVAAFAAAAAVVFSLLPATVAPLAPVAAPSVAVLEVAGFQLATVNDAEVEDMEYAEGVLGGIIPPQADGEPLVIVVDDSALVAAADIRTNDVPMGTHL